jgi:gliding motility-associated-like protein
MDITAYAGSDAIICVTDSIHLGRPQEVGLECLWYKPTIATPFASTSDIWFKPTQAGTYTFIQRMDNCQITFDTVNITVLNDCSSLLPLQNIPNVFTPNGDGINDVWEFSLGLGNTLKSLTIVNRWGNLIQNSILNTNNYISWDGKTTSGEACSEGVYFYTLQYTDAKGDTQKKNGYVSLFR